MNRKCCCLFTLVSVGVVLLVAAVAFLPISKNLIHDEIKKEVSLNVSDTYNNWVKSPVPIYFQLWMWNLTNPDEVKLGGKPSIVDKGPYTYSETRQKVNITFHDNNSTVTYRELKFYEFVPHMSVGPESDKFRTINIPMMLIANLVKFEGFLAHFLANLAIKWANETLIIEKSVRELVWGYDEPLINKTVTDLAKVGIHLNISDRFGLFSTANGSDDGIYNVFTGNGASSSKFGIIGNWNYMEKLPYWNTDTCNLINGTDGTIYPPFVDKSERLYLYSSDICRSIYVTYSHGITLKDVDLYRFVVPPDVFKNGTHNPVNEGFCVTRGLVCLNGLLDVENCRQGAPVIFSQPHFLDADPEVINAVDGVHPDKAKHQTYIDIEPNTGAAFRAAKKLQVNVLMQKVSGIEATEHLHDLVLPVLWLTEGSEITDKLANKFKSQLMKPELIIHVSIYVAIGLGCCLILSAALFVVVKKILARSDPYDKLTDINPDKLTDINHM